MHSELLCVRSLPTLFPDQCNPVILLCGWPPVVALEHGVLKTLVGQPALDLLQEQGGEGAGQSLGG